MPKPNPLRRIRELASTVATELVSTLELWLIKKSCLGHVDGIAICDNSMVRQNRDNFLTLTRQAMALIQSMDPRRYRRLCRHVRFIVNIELISGGDFARVLKICHVDYSKFTSADPLWNLRQYAQLLIHEATHGLLFEKGILYDKETRERVERLCRREEYRFALHFEPGYVDAGVLPFNAELYKLYWDPKARRAAVRKRLWEALRARKKASDVVATPPLPMDAKAYNELGELSQREGSHAKAISYFSHAIQLDPRFARAYCNRGLVYRYGKEYDKAIADYDLAIQLDSHFALAYNNRGYAYFCKGEYDKAVADLDLAIEIDPTYVTAYANRGRTHRTARNYENAIADYSRLIELSPRNTSAYNNLAWILGTCPQNSLRNGGKAVEMATKACELSEWKYPSALNTLALAYAEIADFVNAEKWQSHYLESPNLSSTEITTAKRRLAVYQAHLRGDHNKS